MAGSNSRVILSDADGNELDLSSGSLPVDIDMAIEGIATETTLRGLTDIDFTFNRNADTSISAIVITDGADTNTMTFNRNADGTISDIQSVIT